MTSGTVFIFFLGGGGWVCVKFRPNAYKKIRYILRGKPITIFHFCVVYCVFFFFVVVGVVFFYLNHPKTTIMRV